MADPHLAALRRALEALRAKSGLTTGSASLGPAALRAEHARLSEAVEAAADELKQLRQELDVLRASLVPLEGSPAPGARAGHSRLRTDHLGASTYRDKGWSLMASGDRAGAIQALRQALRLAPQDSEAEVMLGWALMLEDRLDEALATFSQVLEREPRHPMARVNLGYICLRRRIFGEAIEHLTRVLHDSQDRKALLYANYYLGLVYFERGMFGDALPFFRQALVLGPNLHEAAFDLGRALWFAGQHDAARDTWRRAAAADPGNSWSARCADLLATADAGGEVPRTRLS